MNKKQIVEKFVRNIIKEQDEPLDGNDVKAMDGIVQALSKMPYPKHSTNDRFTHQAWERADQVRMDLMRYIKEKTNYDYIGKGSGWKLVKKK